MKVGVVVFPGSNCEHDVVEAVTGVLWRGRGKEGVPLAHRGLRTQPGGDRRTAFAVKRFRVAH